MTSFNHHLTADEFAGGTDIGLNYGSLSAPVVGATANDHFNFHIGSALASGGTCGGGGGSFLSSLSGLDQWRLQQAHQQFPFLDSTSSSPLGLYGVDASGYNGAGQVRPKISSPGFSQLAAAASVKMEENRHHHHHHHQQQQQQIQEMNLSRQFMEIQGNDQYWNTNTGGATAATWTDISTFSSSSTGNPL